MIDSDASVITATAPADESGARIVTVRVEMDYRPWFAFMVPNFTMAGESRGFIAFNYD